jgi:endonuclease III
LIGSAAESGPGPYASSPPPESAGPGGAACPAVPEIAALLEARYGKYPDESAGPVLDQLVWFLLSTRTTVQNCEAAYAALRGRCPSWESVAQAREEELGPYLRPAGLWRSRARNLLASLAAVRERFGSLSLEGLRAWGTEDCERFLLSLPGVGLKVARCVISFGLGRPAFAVDAHIWRITRRLGWHSLPGDAPSARGADLVQDIAREARDPLSLHVNLIRLGREFCHAGEPRCAECPLARLCYYNSVG